MDRRVFLTATTGGLLGSYPIAHAQPAKTFRIGVVFPGGPYVEAVYGLKDGLKQLGFVEGAQYVLHIRDEKGALTAAGEAARSLEREQVDLIFALPTSVSLAVKQATERVPIVFWAGNDAVDAGLVSSLARPGGRLTGVNSLSTQVTAKRLQTLKELAPAVRRVVTFYDPANPAARNTLQLARTAAQQLGMDLLEHQVRSVSELQAGLSELKAERADAIFLVSDGMVISQSRLIADVARANKIATMFTDRGAVCQWSSNNPQLWSSNFPHPSSPRSERWKWVFERP